MNTINRREQPRFSCPQCGAPERSRERRPDGNAVCEKGCTYRSRNAVERKPKQNETTAIMPFWQWKEKQMMRDMQENNGISLRRSRDWYHRAYGEYLNSFKTHEETGIPRYSIEVFTSLEGIHYEAVTNEIGEFVRYADHVRYLDEANDNTAEALRQGGEWANRAILAEQRCKILTSGDDSDELKQLRDAHIKLSDKFADVVRVVERLALIPADDFYKSGDYASGLVADAWLEVRKILQTASISTEISEIDELKMRLHEAETGWQKMTDAVRERLSSTINRSGDTYLLMQYIDSKFGAPDKRDNTRGT